MPELILTLADGRRIRHELDRNPLVVGRDVICDLTIDDPSASRRHARFCPTADGYVVEDLGSKNGTLVNDQPCTSRPLQDGDRVLIGSTLAVFRATSEAPSVSVVLADDEPASRATRYVSRERQLLIPQKRLEMIYELSERLTTLQDRDALLDNAMQICFDTLQFERGAIGVRATHGDSVDWPVAWNLRGAEGELCISRSLFSRAFNRGERAIFTEDGGGEVDPTVSMVQQGIRSAMCVPLMSGDQILGVIYGDRTSTSVAYSNEDIDFLAGIARQVSIGLINCWLLEKQREMVRLTHELDLARTIQRGLFPADLPERHTLKVAAVNHPGQHVSGDYYDVLETSDGRLWCLMADVTGEGVAAALLMANLQAAVRVTIEEADDPAALLARWNDLIYRNTEASKFITCALALIDPARREIRFASAGHCPPLLLRPAGGVPMELLGEPGFPLGVVANADYACHRIEVSTDVFAYFCYTDGVTEAMNADRKQYGRDRLFADLADLADLNPVAMVRHIRDCVSKFAGGASQSDDITILAAQFG